MVVNTLSAVTWTLIMEEGVSKICLFVRNLPYSITDTELGAVFKRYGDLRSCYTVKDKGLFSF